jgi:hypothetical protein
VNKFEKYFNNIKFVNDVNVAANKPIFKIKNFALLRFLEFLDAIKFGNKACAAIDNGDEK